MKIHCLLIGSTLTEKLDITPRPRFGTGANKTKFTSIKLLK